MEKIQLSDIDFSKVYELEHKGHKSVIFRHQNECIKIFTGLYAEEKEEIYRKFLELEELNIEGIILPQKFIYQNGEIEGYVMEYYDGSKSLIEKFTTTPYVDIHQMLDAIKKASHILRELHQNEIICQTLSFDKILVDKFGNVKFCDLDRCRYKNNEPLHLSSILKSFIIDYKKQKGIDVTKNLDRLAMMLSLIYLFYLKEIQNISKRNYNKISGDIQTLQNAQIYVELLRKRNGSIPNIPYLDEIISMEDKGYLERDKQYGIVERILRKL